MLVQVYDGGSMPATVPRWFFTHPVLMDGVEAEGEDYTPTADTSVTIPVLVLGSRVPAAGDILIAHGVGGKWVAESGGGGTATYPCSPCNIPLKNLTVSWTNTLLGNGSATLVYTAGSPPTWSTGSACPNEMLFSLRCSGFSILFTAYYFVSGGCPSGQPQNCNSQGGDQQFLPLDSHVCSPFSLTYKPTSQTCPVLLSSGYTSFTVSE